MASVMPAALGKTAIGVLSGPRVSSTRPVVTRLQLCGWSSQMWKSGWLWRTS